MRTSKALVAAFLVTALAGCPDDFGDDVGGTTQAGVSLLVPTNLAGIPQSGTEILVTWTDNSTGETGYRVDTSSIPINSDNDVENWTIIPANSTSYTYTTLPNTTVYFRIVSVHVPKGLQSPFSTVISVTTPNVPPATSVSASLMPPSEINLTWIDLSQESGYRVERSLNGGTRWSTLAMLNQDNTFHSDQGLAGDTEYCYRVIAFNGNGDGPPSQPVCETTPTTAMTITRLASAVLDGWHTSISVDSSGMEHISHYDASNTRTLYTTFFSGTFNTSVADSGVFLSDDVGAGGTSIDLDGTGVPHVATTRFATSGPPDVDLRYATKPGAAMIPYTVDSAGFVGDLPNLRISPSDGSLHIIYLGGLQGSQSVKHASNTGAGWTFEPVFSGQTITSLSFDIDSSGNLHVSFLNTDQSTVFEIHHGLKVGAGSWGFTVAATLTWFADQSISVDGAGKAHVVYERSGDLYTSSNATGAWVEEVVHADPTRLLGAHNSIVINRTTGRIHVAYQDVSYRRLRYARKDPGGSWVLRLVDAAGQVGEFASITLDSMGTPHIAYRDTSNGDLKRASGSP